MTEIQRAKREVSMRFWQEAIMNCKASGLTAAAFVSVKQYAGLTLPLPYEIMLSIKATKFFKLSQFTKCA